MGKEREFKDCGEGEAVFQETAIFGVLKIEKFALGKDFEVCG